MLLFVAGAVFGEFCLLVVGVKGNLGCEAGPGGAVRRGFV